jgi:hypothetical protein
MNTLNLEQIKQDAESRLSLTSKLMELQLLVDELYSGYKVVIARQDAPTVQPIAEPRRRTRLPALIDKDFTELSGVQQMVVILKEGQKTSKSIAEELAHRGSAIALPTVMSTLSRKKELFQKTTDGKWALFQVPHHGSTPQQQSLNDF